jgi:zinc transport system ATP-binding protein
MPLLTIKDLVLGYEDEVIVNDLSFAVNEKDYLCIVGENGSGKTTLIKTLVGLKRPMSGEIIFGDGLKADEIGYLPQQSDVQKDFPASVNEVVMSGNLNRMKKRFFYNADDKNNAMENMRRLDILSLKEICFRDLSGGQQQRVLLARALCATSRMLLLDEPVSGLDPEAREIMYSLIKKLNDEGITIVMISHDLTAALKYASHILHIGDDIFYGSKDAYFIRGMIRKESFKEDVRV